MDVPVASMKRAMDLPRCTGFEYKSAMTPPPTDIGLEPITPMMKRKTTRLAKFGEKLIAMLKIEKTANVANMTT